MIIIRIQLATVVVPQQPVVHLYLSVSIKHSCLPEHTRSTSLVVDTPPGWHRRDFLDTSGMYTGFFLHFSYTPDIVLQFSLEMNILSVGIVMFTEFYYQLLQKH